MNNTVLVLDGETRAALAVVRNLGQHGITVIVGAQTQYSLATSSRYCAKSVLYESPSQPALFYKSISLLLEQYKPSLLMPITDMSMHAVLLHLEELQKHVIVPVVSLATYWAASNKCSLVKLAQEIGVACPKTQFYTNNKDVLLKPDLLEYPVVIKPQASLLVNNSNVSKTSVRFANSETEFKAIIEKDAAFTAPFMVQERLEGEGLGIFALCKNGETLAVFSHKRIREKPPWGGVSVVCESTEPDPVAKVNASALLKKLNWTGVAMVEFKRDNRTGIPCLMEINARFWGSLQLAIDAKVEFPWLLYELATQNKIEWVQTSCKARSHWLLGDVDNLIITLKMRVSPLKKIQALCSFVYEFFKGSKIEEIRYGDIGVLLYSVKNWFKV